MTRRRRPVLLMVLTLASGIACDGRTGQQPNRDGAATRDAAMGPEAGAENGAETRPERGEAGGADVADAAGAKSEAGPESGREVASREAVGEVRREAGVEAGGDGPSGTDNDSGVPADMAQPVYQGRPQPMCVWNQAYQENYAADSVAEILAGARNCYVLVDPFADNGARNAIAQMKRNGNLVSCYISVGTCEDWRDDFAAMKPYCVSKQWGEWPGEYFVDRTETALVDLMKARIDRMAAWGCDMVEFDNMDFAFDAAYRSQYGISTTAAQGQAYDEALCAHVHASGMGCMAKSSALPAFDGLTVESAPGNLDWWDESDMTGMLSTGRIGIVVHYDESDCAGARTRYQAEYGGKLSFICEDKALKKYLHFP